MWQTLTTPTNKPHKTDQPSERNNLAHDSWPTEQRRPTTTRLHDYTIHRDPTVFTVPTALQLYSSMNFHASSIQGPRLSGARQIHGLNSTSPSTNRPTAQHRLNRSTAQRGNVHRRKFIESSSKIHRRNQAQTTNHTNQPTPPNR